MLQKITDSTTEGTHFFDVTDPQNSTQVAFVEGAYTGSGVVHRDYHDYQGYLYIVCDEGWSTSTLQIVDISNLPTSLNVVYDSDSLFNTSHNIFIDTATSKLYACASNSAMDIYSLDTPTLPNLIYSYTDVGHVHDAYVRNDTAYLNCGNDGFRIIDFHYLDLGGGMAWDELASFTSYPDAGYNHSGWLSDDGTIYAMQDENHGYDVKIMDVSDLNNITVLSTLNSGENAQSMAHNGIIKGNLLYLAYYHDGLRVFDISDPSNPIQICNYDTYSPASYNSYKGAWGVYPNLPSGNIIVSDMQSGLYVLDCTVPVNSVKNINQNLNIYPNPAKDYFNVNKDAKRIEIYDISGRKITQKIIEIEHKFYREDIANGLYIYRLFNKRDLEIENGKIIFE
ncbi:MAG: choice-of-anchor B family protein [Flavobacteriales bacterium]|nr:choice-of-anchor B family protein [Flavobacteriales bacterium]